MRRAWLFSIEVLACLTGTTYPPDITNVRPEIFIVTTEAFAV